MRDSIEQQQYYNKRFHDNKMGQTGPYIEPRTDIRYQIRELQDHQIRKHENDAKDAQNVLPADSVYRPEDATGENEGHCQLKDYETGHLERTEYCQEGSDPHWVEGVQTGHISGSKEAQKNEDHKQERSTEHIAVDGIFAVVTLKLEKVYDLVVSARK